MPKQYGTTLGLFQIKNISCYSKFVTYNCKNRTNYNFHPPYNPYISHFYVSVIWNSNISFNRMYTKNADTIRYNPII